MKKINCMMMAVMLGLLSCGNPQEQGKEHEHSALQQMSAYSEDYELYAEVHPLAVGEESPVMAHLTRLSDYKPEGNAPVRLTVKQGMDSVVLIQEKPVRQGVYQFQVTPRSAGTATFRFQVQDQELTASLEVCADLHQAQHLAEDRTVRHSNGIPFSKEKSWSIQFGTEVCRSAPFGTLIRAVGQVLPAQGDEQMVVAKSTGLVSFEGRQLTPGKRVVRDQHLFFINGSEMIDNNLAVRYQEAESNFQLAKAEYDRKSALAAEKIVSEAECLRARRDYENAKVLFENFRNNFQTGKQVIKAPMDGYVKEILVEEGRFVTEGEPLVLISQNRNLHVKARVPARYYPELDHIATATFQPGNGSSVYRLEDLDGKLLSYSHSVKPDNPLLDVVFQVRNTRELLSGSLMDIRIRTSSGKPVLTVPVGALIEQMGNYFVYVQLTPEYFEKREVTIGATDGLRTVVTGGLAEGERIVSRGASLLKLAQAAGTLDAHDGHNH